MNVETEPITTQIDTIIQYGNRGHWFGYGDTDGPARENRIDCIDGFNVSVIAGGGAYCWPKPALCMCQLYMAGLRDGSPPPWSMTPFQNEVAHDYHGPYAAVEVGDPNVKPEPWDQWEEYAQGDWEDDRDGPMNIFSYVPADLVRALIISHGGEVPRPDSYYTGEVDDR